MQFFDGYGALESKNIHIEEFNGKRTGSALIILDSPESVQKAKEDLNKKEIGTEGRWVELCDSEHPFMRKICKLPALE